MMKSDLRSGLLHCSIFCCLITENLQPAGLFRVQNVVDGIYPHVRGSTNAITVLVYCTLETETVGRPRNFIRQFI
jgi:hypothetical protein